MIYIKNLLVLFIILTSFTFSGCSPLNASTSEEKSGVVELQGNITVKEDLLDDEYEGLNKLISSYFTDYFQAISLLEEKDITSYYVLENPTGQESALINQFSLNYLINLRKLQENDLKINDYKVTAEISSIASPEEPEYSAYTEIKVLEYSTLNFAFLPDVAAHSYGIEHVFIVDKVNDEWKFIKHSKMEDVNYLIEDLYQDEKELSSSEEFDPKTIIEGIINKLLEETYVVVAEEKVVAEGDVVTEGNEVAEENFIFPDFDHKYNREDAVAYAMTWASLDSLNRNPIWFAYDERGGNCNNYVSQSLLAGGIPMDTKGYVESQWKWYDDRINGKQSPWGRSPSWTGVNQFYNYVNSNSGFGLVAFVSDDYYIGEIGDVIIYGTQDRWKHAVIITDVIKDEEGNLIDYLINSNSTDRIHYPVSAYGYNNKTLIKILGWNE